MPALVLPRLYCIVDAATFARMPDPYSATVGFTRELVDGGATLIQYRNKSANPREVLAGAQAALAGARTPGSPPVQLILNDRADLALIADYDGVHVGQDDLSADAARRVFGTYGTIDCADTASAAEAAGIGASNSVLGSYSLLVGVSTHSPDQVKEADETSADYIAVGPVFATASKENPDPVIGLDGVRGARALTRKPLVAIGGITRQNARSVLDAGADSVAVISDLTHDPRRAVEEFLRLLA